MDTINDNRQSPDFAGQVNRMFDRVAGRYDLLNSVMTAGLHHRWRARAAERGSSEKRHVPFLDGLVETAQRDISLGMDPDATGYDNIMLRSAILGLTPAEAMARIEPSRGSSATIAPPSAAHCPLF